MSDDAITKNRRIYGAGLREGMVRMLEQIAKEGHTPSDIARAVSRSRGKLRSGSMTNGRLRAAENSLNSMAKKVLSCTPSDQEVDAARVCSVMKESNLTGNPDLRVVTACLKSLCEHGLVRESKRGGFVRVPYKSTKAVDTSPPSFPLEAAQPISSSESISMPSATVTRIPIAPAASAPPVDGAAPKSAATDSLGALAALARRARDLSEAIAGIASEIEEVAIEVERERQKVEARGEKVRQLQVLLKSLGADEP